MKAEKLRAAQANCKSNYLAAPESAFKTLSAMGVLDPVNLSCRLTHPIELNPAGLHPDGGGDGSFVCPVEIMLSGLVTCAGVTMCAVAHAMKIEIEHGEIIAEGDIDFRGTLAVDRNAPVGLTAIRLKFRLTTKAENSQVEKLLELTHRYCVVHRTLDAPPPIDVELDRS